MQICRAAVFRVGCTIDATLSPCSVLYPGQQRGTTEGANKTPPGTTQNPGSIQASDSEPARGNRKRRSTRKRARGNQTGEDTMNPAPAATTSTIQVDTHARASGGSSRPTPTTSKTPRARSGWCGFPDPSGSFPGPLGKILN